MYEIILMSGNCYLKTYFYYFIPNVGDNLSIDEKSIFIVKERLLPTTSESKCIVLSGIIV